jgi:hypothetical protein
MDVRLESPSDAAPIRAVLEAEFPTADEAGSVDELRRAGDVVSRWRENRRLRRIFRIGRAVSRAGARAGRRAARATARRRRQSLDPRRFGSLRSWRLDGGFRSRQSRLLRPLRISRRLRERVRITLRRPAFHGWRWGEANGRRTASWDMPTPSPRWDGSTRASSGNK